MYGMHTIRVRLYHTCMVYKIVPYAYGIKYVYDTEQLHRLLYMRLMALLSEESTLQVTIVHTMNNSTKDKSKCKNIRLVVNKHCCKPEYTTTIP